METAQQWILKYWITNTNDASTMNHVTIGILLSMFSLILLYQNQWGVGLVVFIVGIIIMNKKNWKR